MKNGKIENQSSNFVKYGGWTSLILIVFSLVCLVAAYSLHMLSVTYEGETLFSATSYTKDIVSALSELYYRVFNTIGFIMALGFLVCLLIFVFSGIEALATIGILGFGFSVFFISFRSTLLSVAGSVYPGPMALGDYFMIVPFIAATYCFVTAIIKSRFVENFKTTFKCFFLGMIVISIFDIWGIVFLYKDVFHPILATSLIFEILTMLGLSVFSFRTFSIVEKLI